MSLLLDPERMGWWLCQNTPQCPHADLVHYRDEGAPRCIVRGCDCGANGTTPGDVPLGYGQYAWADIGVPSAEFIRSLYERDASH